jgi:hypothetical protein
MRKQYELQSGCMSRAGEMEMTFVLLSRDKAAPEAIRHWVQERLRMGLNGEYDEQIIEALACANCMNIEGAVHKPSHPGQHGTGKPSLENCPHCNSTRLFDPATGKCRSCHKTSVAHKPSPGNETP